VAYAATMLILEYRRRSESRSLVRMSNEYDDLKEKFDLSQDRLETASHTCDRLASRLTEAEKEAAYYRKENERVREDHSRGVAYWKEKSEQAQESVAVLEEREKSNLATYTNLRQKHDALTVECRTLGDARVELHRRIADYEQEVEALRGHLEKAQQEAKNWQGAVEQWREAASAWEARSHKWERDCDTYRASFEASDKAKSDYLDQIDRFQKNLALHKKEIARLEGANTALAQENTALNEANAILSEQNVALVREAEEVRGKITQYRNFMDHIKNRQAENGRWLENWLGWSEKHDKGSDRHA